MEELIKEILSYDIHEAEKKFPKELEKLGWELFHIKPCGCGFRLIEIYIKLHKEGLQKLEVMKNRTARLKDNVLLRVPQMGITWTNDSLDFTDEKAIQVLDKYPAMKSRFAVLPPESQVKKATKKAVKAVKNAVTQKADEGINVAKEDK